MSNTQSKINLIVIPFMANNPLEDDCVRVNLIAVDEFETLSTTRDGSKMSQINQLRPVNQRR